MRTIFLENLDLDRLIVNNNIDDKLHYICSYLALYDNQTIDLKEIDENTGDNLVVHSR